MNEFIVWDKVSKKFTDRICLDANLIRNGISYSLKVEEELFELFYPVGLTDINGKKIYADCSVVELVDSESRGVFFFDEKYLKFKFAFNGDKTTSLGMESFEKTVQFRVIGTLQENPELLKDAK